MALGIGTRGIWYELATMLADGDGLVYANLDRDGTPVPYRTVELAAELGVSESTWRTARDRMLDPSVDLLLAHATPAGTIFQVTRFDAKAKPEKREESRRRVSDLLALVLEGSRDEARRSRGDPAENRVFSAKVPRELRGVGTEEPGTYGPKPELHSPSESDTDTESPISPSGDPPRAAPGDAEAPRGREPQRRRWTPPTRRTGR